MTEDIEVLEVQQLDKTNIYQLDKANIDSAIAYAHMYPRNVSRCVNDAIATVMLSKDVAASCIYEVPRGGKILNGPSLQLALIVVQNWGNVRFESRVTGADATAIFARAVCFDLQKNIAYAAEVSRSIVGKQGRYKPDMIQVTGMAAASIALRNVILKVIPTIVSDAVYNAAVSMITGQLTSEEQIFQKRMEVLKELQVEYKVTEKEILDMLNKAAIKNINEKDIASLLMVIKSFEDGISTPDKIFRPEPEIPVENKTTKELDRMLKLISKCTKLDVLNSYEKDLKTNEERAAWDIKFKELNQK